MTTRTEPFTSVAWAPARLLEKTTASQFAVVSPAMPDTREVAVIVLQASATLGNAVPTLNAQVTVPVPLPVLQF